MNIVRRLFPKVRTLRLEDSITDDNAKDCIAKLLFWRMEDSKSPGRIEIESPGGSVTATFAILDTMAFVGFPIHTHCPTFAGGVAALILARGTKGCRSAGKDAQIILCRTQGGAAGPATDPEQVVKFLMKMSQRILTELSLATGRTLEEVAEAQENERYFSEEEACAFGLIDRVS